MLVSYSYDKDYFLLDSSFLVSILPLTPPTTTVITTELASGTTRQITIPQRTRNPTRKILRSVLSIFISICTPLEWFVGWTSIILKEQRDRFCSRQVYGKVSFSSLPICFCENFKLFCSALAVSFNSLSSTLNLEGSKLGRPTKLQASTRLAALQSNNILSQGYTP